MAALVKPIHVESEIVNFKFPFMILVVLVMLILPADRLPSFEV